VTRNAHFVAQAIQLFVSRTSTSQLFKRPLITPLHVAVSHPQLLPLSKQTAAEFKIYEQFTQGHHLRAWAGIAQEGHLIPPVLQRQYSERGNALTHLFPHCLQPHLYKQHLITTIFHRSFARMHFEQSRTETCCQASGCKRGRYSRGLSMGNIVTVSSQKLLRIGV
jgi:hypothetical protein